MSHRTIIHGEQWVQTTLYGVDLSHLRISFICPVHGAQHNTYIETSQGRIETCASITAKAFCESCDKYHEIKVRFDFRLLAVHEEDL